MKMQVSLASEYALQSPSVRKAAPADSPCPVNWWMSEKFDGNRCVWDGSNLRLRAGGIVHMPAGWAQRLPCSVCLDGELLAGDSLEDASMFRRKRVPTAEEWKEKNVRYMVFDIYDPEQERGVFETRRPIYESAILKLAKPNNPDVPKWVRPVQHILCRDPADADAMFNKITKQHGEGIILRAPQSLYCPGRTHTLIKRKKIDTAIFTVIEGVPGKDGLIHSVQCTWDRVEGPFGVGGLPSEFRTPGVIKRGDRIEAKFRGVSKSGVPQRATMIRRVGMKK